MLDFYVKGLAGGILAGAAAGVVTSILANDVEVGWVVAVVLVVFLFVLGCGLFRRLRTTYTITNQRLTIDIGLLSRDVHQTRLERVQNVNSRQTMLERMLHIGTVDFDTAGEAGFNFAFYGVSHPHEIVRTVDRAIHQTGIRQQGV